MTDGKTAAAPAATPPLGEMVDLGRFRVARLSASRAYLVDEFAGVHDRRIVKSFVVDETHFAVLDDPMFRAAVRAAKVLHQRRKGEEIHEAAMRLLDGDGDGDGVVAGE